LQDIFASGVWNEVAGIQEVAQAGERGRADQRGRCRALGEQPGPGGWSYGIKVRVKFPDGSTADHKQRFLSASDVGQISEGDVVPIRYDPSDYSKVALDTPALEAPLKDAKAAQNARRDAALAHLGEPGSDSGGGTGVQSIPGLGNFDSPEDLKSKLLQLASEGRASVIDLSGSSPSAQSGSNPEDRLAKLADLKERGVLTDDEFAAEKAKILSES
jgi:hypothetical protein